MAPEFIYTLQELRKVVPPDRVILDGMTLAFLPGAKIGVVGPNGTGKSSLLRILAGVDTDFTGEAHPADGIRIGFLSQEPELQAGHSVLECVEEGMKAVRELLQRFDALSARFAEPLDDDAMNALLAEQAELQDAIEVADGWELERRLEIAMDALQLPAPDVSVDTLSGGERRRVALCRLLLGKPDLLLLDEPTNHLDAESVAWLERHLQEYPGTVIAVTHDRYFLDNAAEWILELDRSAYYPFHGNYTSWLEQKQARLDVEGKQASARRRTLERELDWVRMTPRSRQTKNKARLRSYEQLRAEEEGRLPESVEIAIPPGPRLGDVVIEADAVTKGFADRVLIEDLSFRLPPGGIVGVIGPNGVGKTTLFRMIAGEEKPDRGALHLGETVQISYVDQSRENLDAAHSVWEEISGGEERFRVGSREIASRAYVSSFGFRGADQQKKVGDLSGGERNRVQLAKLLRSGGNVLLLDEPSNDLDVDTLRALEEALLGFSGCVVVISHDRWFLDRIATHILAFEGEGHVEWFEGNFEAYESDRRRRTGDDPDHPRRFKFKRLERN